MVAGERLDVGGDVDAIFSLIYAIVGVWFVLTYGTIIMHLRFEWWLVYALALVPLVLCGILLLVLLPEPACATALRLSPSPPVPL